MPDAQAFSTFGVIAFIPILLTVIVYLYGQIRTLQAKYDALLEKRGDEHKEALLALSDPIERLVSLQEFTQNVLPTPNKRGR